MPVSPFKTVTTLIAVALGLLLSASESEAERQAKADQKAHQEKYAKAKALFEKRCKTAGLVVRRTVKDVEGIELLRVRPDMDYADKRYFDPMWEEAAIAAGNGGEAFIKDFLLSEVRFAQVPDQRNALARPERQIRTGEMPMRPGYRFVDYVDPRDGIRYRYTLPWDPTQTNQGGELDRVPSPGKTPRYAFSYEGIVNPEDRAYWVAGIKLKAIDQQSGEVIAELTRHVIDPGFGLSTSGRWPWQHANTRLSQRCPTRPTAGNEPTGLVHRHFIDIVLIPKQGD